MLIPNSLRQEHMPKMIYSLVKLVNSASYDENDLCRRMTASMCKEYESESREQFRKLLSFAVDGKMINKDPKTDLYSTEFSKEDLSSYSNFTYALLGKMSYQDENKFNVLLNYYLRMDAHFENVHTDTAGKFREIMLENPKTKDFGLQEDTIHGFLFWLEAFGISNFNDYRKGHVYFSLENLLIQYFEKHPELKSSGSIPTRTFLDLMSKDLFFIPYCYDGNEIFYPLSQALRILDNMGIIDMEYRQDSDQIWHLYKSAAFNKGNQFSNIKVK